MPDNVKIDDTDAGETQEWLESLNTTVAYGGLERGRFIVDQLLARATALGCAPIGSVGTPYRNTITTAQEGQYPGDLHIEGRIRDLLRWNAVAIVVRAQERDPDLGGHIGTFASSALLYDVGFNHFWRASTPEQEGDLIYIQGHGAPGIYARSFLEGRLSADQIDTFRQEALTPGLSSYPHPWLMPDYWQFPTVSMGLGPIQAIYQARLMKYRQARGLEPKNDRKVWCFCGDGEMDEPESLGAIGVAVREGLDNLIFVVNCNLQRLDGPVRGNGKIIQELEATFSGAGWDVIKAVWGRDWDPLLQADDSGELQARMDAAVDGDYQNYKAKGGAYTREHFFGVTDSLKQSVSHLTDDNILHLKRGGHDVHKVYAAYARAQKATKPTVLLMKTVKGYGLGKAGEALNTAHNTKKVAVDALKEFRDRFEIPISDKDIGSVPFYRPPKDSPESEYLRTQRERLGGYLPARRMKADKQISMPPLSLFDALLKGSNGRSMSTTMAFVRIIGSLLKDKDIGKRLVPIVPDEARTFGMEGLFRQVGIYAAKGQLYDPVDKDQVMFYKESESGQILQEGLNEAGAFCSWAAAGNSYSNHNDVMIPFYIYYSMFGFQRIGDLAWAAGDARVKGFLIGATSGRTTLNGEGLQHADGHSHIMAATIPNCISYDPTFGYEMAIIIQDGLRRMYGDNEDVYYYITAMNENYEHPPAPKGCEADLLKGMYLFEKPAKEAKANVHLLGSGAILNEVRAAAKMIEKDFGIASTIWSATSFNELARDGHRIDRLLERGADPKEGKPHVTKCLEKNAAPTIAATDYIKFYSEQIRPFVPGAYYTLGTDGYGRSDSRAHLRQHFEVDRKTIAYMSVRACVIDGTLEEKALSAARKKYDIDPSKADPHRV